MVEITTQMVKELRQHTGSPVALCKEALVATDGDFQEAELYLRKKDKDRATKKSHRATGEGVVLMKIDDDLRKGALIELACETDFVARNDRFQALAASLADAMLRADKLDDLQALALPEGRTAQAAVHEAVATIGENIRFRRAAVLEASAGGRVAGYQHFTNKAASLVALSLEGLDPSAEAVDRLARDLCMHIASARPTGLTREDIPQDVLAREREVYAEEIQDKPEDIQERILEGKLSKFYKTRCLNEQGFVKEEKVQIKDHVARALKDAGGKGAIAGFARLELGAEPACVGGTLVQAED